MADSDYSIGGGGDFCPVANLADSVSYLTERFSIRNLIVDEGDSLYAGMAAMIDEEIVVVRVVGDGYIDVARGCSDTIPALHGQDAAIWFYPDNVGLDLKEYSAGEQISVKPLPWLTSGAVLPVDESPPKELTMNYRFSRPYPPGLMQSNGTPWFQPVALSATNANMVLTWTHRDRVLQEDRQIDHFQDSIGPEPGTTYVARVYDRYGELRRTETGLTNTTWAYTWRQAMSDLGLSTEPAGSQYAQTFDATMTFASLRDGLESWQFYTLPFTVNNEAPFVQVAQLAEIAAQRDADPANGGTPLPLLRGMFVTSVAETTLSEESVSSSGGGKGPPPAQGMFVTAAAEKAAQLASIYTWMNRALFEAPYTFLLRRNGSVPASGRVVTVAARPSDRLTDSHKIYSREAAEANMPQPPYEQRDTPAFTPWAVIDTPLDYLTNMAAIRVSSLFDGVPLEGVQPGQLAMIGTELVAVVAITSQTVTLARGCVDTVPAKHNAGTRIWFFETAGGFDPTAFTTPPVQRVASPLACSPDPGWVHLQYKMVPDVFGPDLDLDTVPTDTLDMMLRNQRPFPPGQVTVNGKHWFQGAQVEPDRSTIIAWVQRNRIAQGIDIVDHTAPHIAHEAGTTYRIRITLSVRPQGSRCPVKIIVREEFVTGNRYEYTYDMAYADGNRIARTLSRYNGYNVCGAVSVPITIDAMREDKENWQGYSIMMRLPAPRCPVGPGGPIGGPSGQAPGPGNGNGNVGEYDPGDGSGGGGTGPGNDSGDPDGGGPRPPDPLPPDWPDPVNPPDTDPTEPSEPASPPPEGVGYWDYRWNTFWASRGIDYNPGDGADPIPNESNED